MGSQIDETFSLALRAALVQHVSRTPARSLRRRWRARPGWQLGVLAAVLAGGGGVALATGVLSANPPGSPIVAPLTQAITVTGDGTQTIALGPRPAGANAIAYEFRCLTAGTFQVADGTYECDQAELTDSPVNTVALTAGQDNTTITAGAGERWQITAYYASVTTGQWLTNASGQSYGVANQNGTPDLVAVIATDGRSGYVYASELNPPAPTSPAAALAQQAANTNGEYIPVYASDGTTVVGRFEIAEPGADAG